MVASNNTRELFEPRFFDLELKTGSFPPVASLPKANPEIQKIEPSGKLPPPSPDMAGKLLSRSQSPISLGIGKRVAKFFFSAPGTNLICLYRNTDDRKTDLVEVLNTVTGENLPNIFEHPDNYYPLKIEFRPECKYFATADLTRAITVYAVANGRPLLESWSLPPPPVKKNWAGDIGAFYLLDKDRLVTIEANGDARAWQLPAMKMLWFVPHKYFAPQTNPIGGHNALISPDRSHLAIFNAQGFSILNTGSGRLEGTTWGIQGDKTACEFGTISPDGQFLIAHLSQFVGGGRQGSIVAFEMATGFIRTQLPIHESVGKWPAFAGITYLGPDLVMAHNSGGRKNYVVPLHSGAPVAFIEAENQPSQGPDNRLWYLASYPPGPRGRKIG